METTLYNHVVPKSRKQARQESLDRLYKYFILDNHSKTVNEKGKSCYSHGGQCCFVGALMTTTMPEELNTVSVNYLIAGLKAKEKLKYNKHPAVQELKALSRKLGWDFMVCIQEMHDSLKKGTSPANAIRKIAERFELVTGN